MFATKKPQKLNKLCKLALIRDGSKAQTYLQAQITSPSAFPGTEGDLCRLCLLRLPALLLQAPWGGQLGQALSQAKNPCLGHESGAGTAPFAMLQVCCLFYT